MESLEFWKEYTRMCTECKDCYGCPLAAATCAGSLELSEKQIINLIEKTEQWSKEHPIITNAMKFKEVFGEIKIKDLIHIDCNCTSIIDDLTIEINGTNWWDEPYKEPKE